MSSLELVRRFHEVFNHPIHDKPYLKDSRLSELRINLLQEELNELKLALSAALQLHGNDQYKCEVLDALCDLQVVLDGAFLALGFHRIKGMAIAEVMHSNMSKLGINGLPHYRADGKILKGPNYLPPNLQQIVKFLYE